MPLEKSSAVILKMFNWAESSRTVLFFTERFGKLPLVDRGGRSMKSKRGRLQTFTLLDVTFYHSEKETSGYISDVEARESFGFSPDGELGRLAYGAAACELLYLLLPQEEAQPSLYSYFLSFLRRLAKVDKRALPSLFVAFYLRLMSQLGYHPSLGYCSGCRKEIGNGKNASEVLFSPERGGVVCPSCQKPGEYYISLSANALRMLQALQQASLDEAASLSMQFGEATVLVDVLTKFLRYHSGLVSDLKSLEFLEKLKKTDLN